MGGGGGGSLFICHRIQVTGTIVERRLRENNEVIDEKDQNNAVGDCQFLDIL